MMRPAFCLLPVLLMVSGCTALSDFGSFKFKPTASDAGTGGGQNDKDASGGDGQHDSGTNVTPGEDAGSDSGVASDDGGTGGEDASVDAGPKPDPICDAADCDPVAKCNSSTGVAVCTCPNGYYDINGDGTRCVDLDECKAGVYQCDDDASCMNKAGGYDCLCNPGFTCSRSTGASCESDCLDSCLVLLSTTCDPNVGLCTKPDGNAVCRCPSGYTDTHGDGTLCAPDSGCMALNCDPLAQCDSTQGSPVCVCPTGYSGDGTKCADIDECDPNQPMNDCSTNASCTNTDGGYACKCKDGYSGDGKTCLDKDECTAGTAQCSTNAKCTNTDGSYTCSCKTGFSGDGVLCTDDDECKLGTAICSTNANCTNTVGSYTCKCKDGYSGDGKICDDINECTAGTANCAAGEKCTNTIGSYTCGCDAGYQKNANGQCVDVDECTAGLSNCSINASCTNTTGSFTCKCKNGYSGDGVTCQDIDECAPGGGNNCSTNASCTNTAGSFSCTCKDGYKDASAGAGTTCNNINECADVNANNCHTTRATCTDKDPTLDGMKYKCDCKTGYSGDGVTCNDNNECSLNTDNCDDSPDACVNTTGSFMCTCPTYWTGTGVGSNGCSDINECSTSNGGCGSATYWTCGNNVGAAPTCTDINECATNNGNCGSATYWTCTNNVGAAPTCTDINECNTNNGGCDTSPMATCTNKTGAAPTCTCPAGYSGTGVGASGCNVVCGDGQKHSSEACDDANTSNGDGCSSTCTVESGWTCSGQGAGSCTDINECATNNGNCGSATYWTCTNNVGAAPTCTDIDECATNNGGCDTSPMATCTNKQGAAPTCTCPSGYSGTGVGASGCNIVCGDGQKHASEACDDGNTANSDGCSSSCTVESGYTCSGQGPGSCTDINECTKGTHSCSIDATCTNTNGGYSCACNSGYIGHGRICIKQLTSFPEPGAATSTADVTLAVSGSNDAGATFKCRVYKRSGSAPSYSNCTRPVLNPNAGTSSSSTNDGAWRTEMFWLYSDGTSSGVYTYDYYVHNSLNGVKQCTSLLSLGITDAQLFDAAIPYLAAAKVGTGYTDPGPFITSGASMDTYLAAPFVTLGFKPILGGWFSLRRNTYVSVNPNTTYSADLWSLRKRFVASSDNRYVLIRRPYAQRGPKQFMGYTDICTAADFEMVYSMWATGTGGTPPNTYTYYKSGSNHQHWHCQAVVVNRAGAGVCLNVNAGVITVAPAHNSGYGRAAGYGTSDKFMWQHLLDERGWFGKFPGGVTPGSNGFRNFSPKCATAGCNSDDTFELYLPDKSILKP